jgi:ABC-type uncharacterized transport system involved in gliding motility auxiliary subunit
MSGEGKQPKLRGFRRALHGANFALYTAIIIAMIVVANWFVNRHDHRWDLTPNKQFTLSPQSMKLLRSLKRNVTIYVFDQKNRFAARRDLLGEYQAASHYVKVDYVDPDRDPGLAREFNVRSYGTIVVEVGKRHFQASGATEAGVTNALIHVLMGEKDVCFIEGHGEHSLNGTSQYGYSQWKKSLSDESYEVQTLVLMQKNQIPSTCSMVVVAGPRHDYLPPEIATLKKYVEDGGRALFMLDAGTSLPNLDSLLAGWGVQVKDDLVIDLNPIAQLFQTTPDMPLILSYGSSSIVQPLKRTATLFPLACSFDISNNSSSGVTDESLAKTSADSYGYVGFNPNIRQVSFRPGKDIKGPLSVAVDGKIPTQGSGKHGGRFVVLGSSEVASNAYLGFQGNRDLVMNTVNWLTSEENLISIRPKPPLNQHLTLNERQMGQILYLGVIGLPLAILILGGAVWWHRR